MEKRIIEFEGKGIFKDHLKTKFDSKEILVKHIPHTEYELKREIPVSLKNDKGALIASYEKIGSFGLGANEQEAINDLLFELVEIYKDIENNGYPLGRNSRLWWRQIQKIIKKKANA